MGLVFADPDMLDRLAKSMDSQAGSIPGLRTRASNLGVSGEVSGLTALANWLGDEALELRKKARILRAPSESPFGSLSKFGLPTGLAKQPGAGEEFESGLKKVLADKKDATPQERAAAVKSYFATLKPEQQAALAIANPELVGNTDGVPVNVRFAANRISIQKQYDKEKKYLDGLSETDPAFKRTKTRVETLRSFLNPRMKTFVDPKTHRTVTEEVPRQFLAFEPHAGSVADPKASPFPDGRVAEVVGDLENAENVSFRVPGITNRLDNFNGFSKGGYELMKDGKTERTDTAVVSWLGYDTPEIGDSVDPAKAEDGGRRLNAFRQGISVNLKSDAKTNIFAHSYGTLVTSKALQNGLTNIDTVTFMGSPGLGPNIHKVADFHMPNTKFFAMRAPKDPVSYTQGHGDDPADFEDITRLGTDKATGHSMYYDEGTGSLANLQSILFGGQKKLTFTDTTLDEEMVGAEEMRKLVGFLHERVPPEVVERMGADLDPIVQSLVNGRTTFREIIGPLHAVLNKHNMLDRVKPDDLFDEVNSLASDIAYKQAYKAAKDKGAPDWVAKSAALAAKGGSTGLLKVLTWPVVKGLQFDRLQNNTRQFLGILKNGGSRMLGDVRELGGTLKDDGGRILSDGKDMAGSVLHTGGNTVWEIGDTLVHPTEIGENFDDVVDSLKGTKDTFVEKGTDILNTTDHAWNTTVDKGGDIIDTGVDTVEKGLDKGKDVVDSAVDFVNPF
ncbi:alpha/beta hydrolase family protein [Streptomyces sp. SCSIO ZS0520]|uniref:alpha/beta hydrolase family protein n=1 Tax=Streptomyces sp. SCSIO ZS0520 TaxID=2892996 RepID=UPI0021D9D49A|nr:alpha/beta hydrolase family protein [Streptomyces sp. SCSIO ZS0520]